ncbi:hypothetical protein [Demequina sp.]|uniref:hypothetical protein n=1 Tax=Demequina sp. TaxID=2050685 RepID=UPI003D14D8F9
MKTEGIVKRACAAAALTAGLMWLAPAALADSNDNGGFEGFALGNPVGQFGWTANDIGGYNAAAFDLAIVDPSGVWGSTFGDRALRMSNGVTSGGFGNQLQTVSLTDEAGETEAVSGPLSGGNRQTRFSGSMTFASATQSYQPGMAMSFSPDRGDGARMSYFRLSDQADGLMIEVGYFDVTIDDFVYETLASGLSRTEPHTLDFTLDFVDGVDNDILWAQVGTDGCGTWVSSGSWEDYHRYFDGTKPVDSILFRLAGTAVPANTGGGFLFDDISLTSSTVPAALPPGVPTVTGTPTAASVGQHVDVTYDAATSNACQPVTSYTATLTPLGGGSPISVTSASPDFDFDGVPPGNYTVVVTATNSAGTSVDSASTNVSVAAVVSEEEDEDDDPTQTPVDEDGDGNPDGELAATGPTLTPLALAALGLVGLGFVMRRRAA